MLKSIAALLTFSLFTAFNGENLPASQDTVEMRESAQSDPSITPILLIEPDLPSIKKALITFIDLGTLTCIPCKKMQVVMKYVEEKYGDQVEIIFYNVSKADEKKYARIYNIRAIPTQVFLDSTSTEIFRHVGYYSEKDIDKFLQSQGLYFVKTGD